MRAPRRDPGSGEIPMRQNALPEGAFPVFGVSWTNTNIKQKRSIQLKQAVGCKTGSQNIFQAIAADRLLLKTEDDMKEIKRGEIYSADLSPGIGRDRKSVV